MAFEEVRFPDVIDYTSTGGPRFETEVVELNGGHEQRNQIWTIARHEYQIQNLKIAADIDEVQTFFNSMRGRLNGFRFKDWADYRSGSNYSSAAVTDEILASSTDGATAEFQLFKRYTVGSTTYTRTIEKPVSSTTVVAVDGSTTATGWAVDLTTGLVTFASTPSAGKVITVGYEFDVPVRFDTDTLDLRHEFYHGATIPFPLVEIKPVPE